MYLYGSKLHPHELVVPVAGFQKVVDSLLSSSERSQVSTSERSEPSSSERSELDCWECSQQDCWEC